MCSYRDGFEVISKDGKATVTLFSNQPEELTVWYKAVKNNIIISARQMVCPILPASVNTLYILVVSVRN